MKPSEKRALEAEKKRLAHEAELAAEPKEYSYGGEGNKSQMPKETAYRRKEGFFQSHIRLITFLIVGSIVIFGFVFGIDMYVRNGRYTTVTNLEDMTLNTVYAIHDNAENMKWQHFKKYNYTDYSYDEKIIREYPITDTSLVLKVKSSGVNATLDYAYLIDYDTGAFVDVLKTDPHDFVKSIGQEEKK